MLISWDKNKTYFKGYVKFLTFQILVHHYPSSTPNDVLHEVQGPLFENPSFNEYT